MKKIIFLVAGVVVFGAFAGNAVFAADFDFLKFTKNTLLACAHPTTNKDDATVDFLKDPKTEGTITKAWVKVFYKGWVKSNAMTIEIQIRKCCDDELLKVKVLEDSSGTGTQSCKYFSGGWFELTE